MKEKTISQLLEEVATEICDNYCKSQWSIALKKNLRSI